jgi:mannose-6-phosphate isomerase-like protein (cupin superfamily)
MNTYTKSRLRSGHNYWRLINGDRKQQIAFLQLQPGSSLSESIAAGKAENLHVVGGTADISVGNYSLRYHSGESVDMAPAQEHKISNPGPGLLKMYLTYKKGGRR